MHRYLNNSLLSTPDMAENCWLGREESNQTNKQNLCSGVYGVLVKVA